MTELRAPNRDEFRRLCDFVYRRTGMAFAESKRYFVERRLFERMAATETASFAAYFALLRADARGEVEQFINAFTVNETYFFREEHQLRCMTSDLLRERTKDAKPGDAIRIWSAPCSTGEEPYSIAIWLLEHWPEVDAFDVEIVGSDIDTQAVEAACAGVFGSRALMRASPALIDKYFIPEGQERWRIIEDLRDSIRFDASNILDPRETKRHGLFDIIFCRNMLIYFDEASRREAAANLYEHLLPGGYICLGHSESMSRISPLFEVRRFADAIVYRKPMEAPHG